jgi:hypothetical protein
MNQKSSLREDPQFVSQLLTANISEMLQTEIERIESGSARSWFLLQCELINSLALSS